MAEDEARKLIEEANRLCRQGDFGQALAVCDKALAVDPQNADAWANRGAVLDALGRHEEALESFDKALALDPQNAVAWHSRGAVLDALERHQEALESYDKALTVVPQDASLWHCRGLMLDNLGRHQEALESHDKALTVVPQDASLWHCRGLMLDNLGRYQEAVESHEEALKHKPDHSEAWAAKNDALNRLQKWLDERRPPNIFVKLFEQVIASEEVLHLFIEQRLKQAFGETEGEWWAKGVPLPIRQKCAQRREEAVQRRPLFSYTYLIDLKEILDMSWRYFEGDFQRVKGSVKSKKEFLDGLARLNEIRKTVMHPVRDVPTEADHEFARQMREVIQDFVGR